MAVATDEKFTCQKCGKSMSSDQFYTYKDGTKTELCKKCLTLHVDNFDENTYLWLLKKMDVPYIPEEWNVLRDRAYAKDPNKMNGMSVFGKYLSKMKLKQWKAYGWADGELIKAQKEQRHAEMDAERAKFDQEVKEQFEKGEITEAEYRTLVSTTAQHEDEEPAAPQVIGNNPFNESEFMSEDELIDPSLELTAEDKIYLAMKWGRLYKPNEWIELERKYNEMMNSFDIQDSDTTGTLILICKTYLKMNQAIDCGDVAGYNTLSRAYDMLRKSAKFTAVQNKNENNNFVDSIGEIVAYCEREKGQIPKFDISTPQDLIDTEINDLKSYTKTLIYQDTALANQIENYLKQRIAADEHKKDMAEAAKKGLSQPELENEDYIKYFDQVNSEKEEDKEIYNVEGGKIINGFDDTES